MLVTNDNDVMNMFSRNYRHLEFDFFVEIVNNIVETVINIGDIVVELNTDDKNVNEDNDDEGRGTEGKCGNEGDGSGGEDNEEKESGDGDGNDDWVDDDELVGECDGDEGSGAIYFREGNVVVATDDDDDDGLSNYCFDDHCETVNESDEYFVNDPLEGFLNRDAGLVETINEIVPHAIHRRYVRHIYANFRLQFVRAALKKYFWEATRSYNVDGFNFAMYKLKELKPAAYDWLLKIPAELWSRHAFDSRLKNDHVTNNISESFSH
ncbi:hypothetical protein Salat_2677200 [Sesamum alatum]|uniref:Transposase n=1 Tax=Sesamum alatum TaxID=300844 RepID=A0AAE2CB45_9LAMI|nr:hypothetical protein Salat_2677200 [Sesamum alatum]